jgi:hypothetical protein
MSSQPSCARAHPTAIRSRQCDDSAQRPQARASIESRGDDEIGQPLLHVIGRLPSENRGQPRRRHAGSTQNPRSLDKIRGADHDHRITVRLAPGLEQQRDVQGDDRSSLSIGLLEEA